MNVSPVTTGLLQVCWQNRDPHFMAKERPVTAGNLILNDYVIICFDFFLNGSHVRLILKGTSIYPLVSS